MSNEYPQTRITIGVDGVIVEIQASETIKVSGNIDAASMTVFAAAWIANQLQRIEQLQQEVNQLKQLLQIEVPQ